jgi:hypothetical protein
LLVAVLSRYKDAFAVIGSSSWLIDVSVSRLRLHFRGSEEKTQLVSYKSPED